MSKHSCWLRAGPPLPKQPLGDVMDMPYSGNKLHPTQKPIAALVPLIRSFTLPGESVLDPFAGSGSSCAAALLTGRKYIGVEMDGVYFQQASDRLKQSPPEGRPKAIFWCGHSHASVMLPACPPRLKTSHCSESSFLSS